jgi:hypothetical protein
VTEGDLRQLVSSLGLGAREPERQGWEHVISKSNDDVSYKAWCDKPAVWLASALFIWLIIRLIRLVFSAGTVFFSRKKSAGL